MKIRKNSCLTSEINSIFNVKSIEFSVYYIFFGFWTHCMQYMVWCHKSLLFSQCKNNTWDIFTVWKYQPVKKFDFDISVLRDWFNCMIHIHVCLHVFYTWSKMALDIVLELYAERKKDCTWPYMYVY